MRISKYTSLSLATCLLASLVLAFVDEAHAQPAPRAILPDAIIDLRTAAGIKHVAALWRYSDTQIEQIAHRDVGTDLKASGNPNHTFDFAPDARATDFNDSKWPIIPS